MPTAPSTAAQQQEQCAEAVSRIFSELKREMDTIVNTARLEIALSAGAAGAGSTPAAAVAPPASDAEVPAAAAEQEDTSDAAAVGPPLRLSHGRTESETPGYDDEELLQPLGKLPEAVWDLDAAAAPAAAPEQAAAAHSAVQTVQGILTAADASTAQGGPMSAQQLELELQSGIFRAEQLLSAAPAAARVPARRQSSAALPDNGSDDGAAAAELLSASGGGIVRGGSSSAAASASVSSSLKLAPLSYQELLDRALAWNPRVKAAAGNNNSSSSGGGGSTGAGGRQRANSTGRIRMSSTGLTSPPDYRAKLHSMQQQQQQAPSVLQQQQHSRSKFPPPAARQQQQQQRQAAAGGASEGATTKGPQPWCPAGSKGSRESSSLLQARQSFQAPAGAAAAPSRKMFAGAAAAASQLEHCCPNTWPPKQSQPRSRSAPREAAAARRHIERMNASPARTAAAARDSILGFGGQQQQQGKYNSPPQHSRSSARSPDALQPMRLTDEEWFSVKARLRSSADPSTTKSSSGNPRLRQSLQLQQQQQLGRAAAGQSPGRAAAQRSSTSPGPMEPLDPEFYRRQNALLQKRAALAATKRAADEDDLQECTFHPHINPASRSLQRSVQQLHAWDAKRKLTVFAKALDKCDHECDGYTFTPSINPLSRQLALANYAVAPDPSRPWTSSPRAHHQQQGPSSPRHNCPSPEAVRMLRDTLPPANVIQMAGPTAQQKAEDVMDLLRVSGQQQRRSLSPSKWQGYSTAGDNGWCDSSSPGRRQQQQEAQQHEEEEEEGAVTDEEEQGTAAGAPAPQDVPMSNPDASPPQAPSQDRPQDRLVPQVMLAALKLTPVQAQQKGQPEEEQEGKAAASSSGGGSAALRAVRGSSSGGLAPATPLFGSLGGTGGSGGGGGTAAFARQGAQGRIRDDSAGGMYSASLAKKWAVSSSGGGTGAAGGATAGHKQAGGSPLSRSLQQQGGAAAAAAAQIASSKCSPGGDSGDECTDLQALAQQLGIPVDKAAAMVMQVAQTPAGLHTVPAYYYYGSAGSPADATAAAAAADMKRRSSSYSARYSKSKSGVASNSSLLLPTDMMQLMDSLATSATGTAAAAAAAPGSSGGSGYLAAMAGSARRGSSSSSGSGARRSSSASSSTPQSPNFQEVKAKWLAKEAIYIRSSGGGSTASNCSYASSSAAAAAPAATRGGAQGSEAGVLLFSGGSGALTAPGTPLHNSNKDSAANTNPFAVQPGSLLEGGDGGSAAAAAGAAAAAAAADGHVLLILTNGASGTPLPACSSIISLPDAAAAGAGAAGASLAAPESCNGSCPPSSAVAEKVEVLLEGTQSVPFELVLSPRSKFLIASSHAAAAGAAGASPAVIDINTPLGQQVLQLVLASRAQAQAQEGGPSSPTAVPSSITLPLAQWQQLLLHQQECADEDKKEAQQQQPPQEATAATAGTACPVVVQGGTATDVVAQLVTGRDCSIGSRISSTCGTATAAAGPSAPAFAVNLQPAAADGAEGGQVGGSSSSEVNLGLQQQQQQQQQAGCQDNNNTDNDLAAELAALLQSASSMSPEQKAEAVARTFAKTISRLNMSADVLQHTIAVLDPTQAAAPEAAAAAASTEPASDIPAEPEADSIQQLLERVSRGGLAASSSASSSPRPLRLITPQASVPQALTQPEQEVELEACSSAQAAAGSRPAPVDVVCSPPHQACDAAAASPPTAPASPGSPSGKSWAAVVSTGRLV